MEFTSKYSTEEKKGENVAKILINVKYGDEDMGIWRFNVLLSLLLHVFNTFDNTTNVFFFHLEDRLEKPHFSNLLLESMLTR